MEQITVAGKVFNAPIRYEEGHELTAGEASALNQTFHENLRNNFAKRVKEADEAGAFDEAAMQAEFDAYAEQYQFGVRSGGGGVSRDPVMQAAMNIAKTQIRAAIKKKYGNSVKVDNATITDKAKQLLASPKGEPIMSLAKQRVAEEQAAAADDLGDLVADLPEKQAAE
jgi:hypothetical protein